MSDHRLARSTATTASVSPAVAGVGSLTQADRRDVLRQFTLYFTPVLLALLVGAVLLGRSNQWAAVQPLLIQEREFVNLASQRLNEELNAPLRHIQSLVREVPVKQVYQANDGSDTRPMAQSFISMILRNPSYNAVRWIDASGQERVRVDWAPQQGEPQVRKDLSSKRDRYFVREALDTPPERTYVSPLDLLVDHGRLVDPPFPTCRLARRVFGPQGQDRGFLMINVAADNALSAMAKNAGPIQGRLILLNAHGQWLRSPGQDDAWAHLRGQADSFGQRHPQVWARMKAQAQGQLEEGDGIWTWSTVDLAQTYVDRVKTREVWLVASRLPQEMLRSAQVQAWISVAFGGACWRSCSR